MNHSNQFYIYIARPKFLQGRDNRKLKQFLTSNAIRRTRVILCHPKCHVTFKSQLDQDSIIIISNSIEILKTTWHLRRHKEDSLVLVIALLILDSKFTWVVSPRDPPVSKRRQNKRLWLNLSSQNKCRIKSPIANKPVTDQKIDLLMGH